MITPKLKVYELAKQLGVDNQYLLEMCKRLGIDTKNTMSVLGSEEVRGVREFYDKHRAINRKDLPQSSSKGPVTEQRVGKTVIRRRATASSDAPSAEEGSLESASAESPGFPMDEPAPIFAEAEVATEEAAPPVQEVVRPAAKLRPIVKRHKVEDVIPPLPPPRPPTLRKESAAPVTPEPKREKEIAPPPPPPAPEPVVMTGKRRLIPSIIKKVSVEKHLGETIGPKREAPPVKKPGTAAPAAAGTGVKKPGGEEEATGFRRLKEVTVAGVPATDTAREAGKRRMLDRQSKVFRSADYLKRELVHATKKKKAAAVRPALKTQITTRSEHKRVVEMGAAISVSDLAHQLGMKAGALIKKLMELGVTASMNEKVDLDTASLVAQEFGWEVKQEVFKEEEFLPTVDLAPEKMQSRGPVVTIMGHVDHGKTSLLDSIRKANVAGGEAGGITQHIGAYTVTLPGKGAITFIDTPGHEAFTAMRARGAKVTDIVILVVSAVDGVMPQTLESVDHAKAAGVPIVVAVNKTDLPDANPDRIKQTLAGHDLNPEEWGGNTIYANVSAKTGKGIPELLDSLLVQAEMLELKANHDVPARGTVIESRLDKNRGSLATVLVQHGVLRTGEIVVSGTAFGKVRAMADCYGVSVKEAGPSIPVEILGLGDSAPVGEELSVVEDERAARDLVDGRLAKLRATSGEAKPKLTIEEMLALGTSGTKELRVILKSDVVGSLEAIKVALSKIPDDKVKLKILHSATGGITESDVNLAVASRAVILGFSVRPDGNARKKAENEKVEVRTYSIIYEMVDEVRNLMEGLLESQIKETVIGHAEVRNIFSIPKIGTIAGSAVVDGKVTRGCFLRLLRDSRVVYEGKVASLRRFKDDVKEVSSGYECGIGVENFNDLKLGDRFEAFVKEEVKSIL